MSEPILEPVPGGYIVTVDKRPVAIGETRFKALSNYERARQLFADLPEIQWVLR